MSLNRRDVVGDELKDQLTEFARVVGAIRAKVAPIRNSPFAEAVLSRSLGNRDTGHDGGHHLGPQVLRMRHTAGHLHLGQRRALPKSGWPTSRSRRT